jgi:hypothetical protein
MYWGYCDQWNEGGTSGGRGYIWVCLGKQIVHDELEYVKEYDLCKEFLRS